MVFTLETPPLAVGALQDPKESCVPSKLQQSLAKLTHLDLELGEVEPYPYNSISQLEKK